MLYVLVTGYRLPAMPFIPTSGSKPENFVSVSAFSQESRILAPFRRIFSIHGSGKEYPNVIFFILRKEPSYTNLSEIRVLWFGSPYTALGMNVLVP